MKYRYDGGSVKMTGHKSWKIVGFMVRQKAAFPHENVLITCNTCTLHRGSNATHTYERRSHLTHINFSNCSFLNLVIKNTLNHDFKMLISIFPMNIKLSNFRDIIYWWYSFST